MNYLRLLVLMLLSSSISRLLRQMVTGKERILVLGLRILVLNRHIVWPPTCHLPVCSKKLNSAYVIIGVLVVGFRVGLGRGLH